MKAPRCFFDLIWQLMIQARKYPTGTFHVDWWTACCAILWLTIFGSPWLASTLTRRYTSMLQTLTSEIFEMWWIKVCFVTKFPVVNLYSQLGILAMSFQFLTWCTDTLFPCVQNVFRAAYLKKNVEVWLWSLMVKFIIDIHVGGRGLI